MPKKKRRGGSPICRFKPCGRPVYARDLCGTHNRQLVRTGELVVIRPYRARTPGTEKFAGLRLAPDTIAQLQHKAEREGRSPGAIIADILEDWVSRGSPRTQPRDAPIEWPT